ncbi:MAG TPA: alanyl-tRNA editing protein [Clostridiales bacterium]|nr:alanyl-tRNA editing protein [Clostridiales bacterium]HBR07459.1 alanyl-tRNA editing protein [Clostridiales bacterium]
MTERLYDVNSHMRDFTAKVLSCAGMNGKYELVLDKTAFFPGGGGQAPDSGKIGGARITDVFERGGDVVHIADAAVPEGQEVSCGIDWETRFRRMQNHSGEHIVSGIVHRLFGYDNVGFHMGDHTVTLDFSGELSPDDVQRIETLANLAVYQNLPVTTAFHTPDELSSLSYRSKLEFTGAVRLVTIPGVDCCACCAPHVEYTGEIGIIKILDAQRHRGGMRLTAACGLDALDDYNLRCENISAISEALSAKQLETAAAVRRVLAALEAANRRADHAWQRLLAYRIKMLQPSEGNLCIFEPEMDLVCLRELVNAGMKQAGGVCAAFTGEDGDYHYIIGSESVDLQARTGRINAAIKGRGGGSKSMIQGVSRAGKQQIETFFLNETV